MELKMESKMESKTKSHTNSHTNSHMESSNIEYTSMNNCIFIKSNMKKKIWEKAEIISDKNPLLYRRDINGNELFYEQFNKNKKNGWKIIFKNKTCKRDVSNMIPISIKNVNKYKIFINQPKKISRESFFCCC